MQTTIPPNILQAIGQDDNEERWREYNFSKPFYIETPIVPGCIPNILHPIDVKEWNQASTRQERCCPVIYRMMELFPINQILFADLKVVRFLQAAYN